MRQNNSSPKKGGVMEISNETIKKAVDFLVKVRGEDEVWVKFIKKDGTTRIMNCTLDFKKIPDSQHPKDVDIIKIINLIKDHNIMHAYDLEKRDWRSVPIDRVEYLETPMPNTSSRIRYKVNIK